MNRLLRKRHIGLISISAVVVMLLSAQSHAQGYYQRYLDVKVTLTNITKSIVLTPPLLAVSKKPQPLFALGKSASDALAMIAEGGDTSKLANVLMSKGIDVYTWDAPIGPASSASLMIRLHPTDYLHLASMLLPTNDAFIGLNGLSVRRLLRRSKALRAYDAGTEKNDELCASIPGPQCGGEGYNPEPGEGIVHPHAGIHGEGDLSVAVYNWGNPVAMLHVSIK